MNLTSPLSKGVTEAGGLPGDSVTSFLNTIANAIGLFPDDSPDGTLGLVMSGLAGVAAALAVALILAVYFRARYRSARDIIRHSLAAVAVIALLAFVASDMRRAALAYLGINPTKPAIEFEIRLPKAAAMILADAQIELHTDKNQTLARVEGLLPPDEAGRSVLKGSVELDFRTTDRVVILNVPGQAQRRFKLRLAANPSHSDQFGPWHLADRVAALEPGKAPSVGPDDTFAIRYRVL